MFVGGLLDLSETRSSQDLIEIVERKAIDDLEAMLLRIVACRFH